MFINNSLFYYLLNNENSLKQYFLNYLIINKYLLYKIYLNDYSTMLL